MAAAVNNMVPALGKTGRHLYEAGAEKGQIPTPSAAELPAQCLDWEVLSQEYPETHALMTDGDVNGPDTCCTHMMILLVD